MLRCAKLSFYEDTITGATFDTKGFRRKCREETKDMIMNAAVVVQSAWRRSLARQYFHKVSRRRVDIEKRSRFAKLRSDNRNIVVARQAVVNGSAVALRTRMKGVSFNPQPAVLTVDLITPQTGLLRRWHGRLLCNQLYPGMVIFHENADSGLINVMEALMGVNYNGGPGGGQAGL